jgi:hypothetical protein
MIAEKTIQDRPPRDTFQRVQTALCYEIPMLIDEAAEP